MSLKAATASVMPNQTRAQIMSEVVAIYREAHTSGRDPWKAVEAACPGIPTGVIVDAMTVVEGEADERWWQSVERTIDGEVIRNALAKAAP